MNNSDNYIKNSSKESKKENNKSFLKIHNELYIELNNLFTDNSFIFFDLCYCGHKSKGHSLNDNQCIKREFCKCLGFFP
jgi:hypothetical protein